MKPSHRMLALVLALLAHRPLLAQELALQAQGAAREAHWDHRFGIHAPQEELDEAALFDDGARLRIAYGEIYYSCCSPANTYVTIADPRTSSSISYYVNPGCSFCGDVAQMNAFLPYDDGYGPRLLVGGLFVDVTGGPFHPATGPLAVYEGESWSSWPGGSPPGTLGVYHLAENGPELFATTTSYSYSGLQVWRWTGATWEALGPPMTNLWDIAYSTVGGLGRLYASTTTGVSVFDAGVWSPVPGAPANMVTLTHYDGPVPLLVGGGTSVPITAWDGTVWSPLGGAGAPTGVLDLVQDRSGEVDVLYAGGTFDFAGGQSVGHVAAWDGAGWRALGSGVDKKAERLSVLEGSSTLLVAGDFETAGGVAAAQLARWNGGRWDSIYRGQGLDRLAHSNPSAGAGLVIEELDLGRGPELYVGGAFDYAGSSPKAGVAVWGGERWEPVGQGLAKGSSVYALESFDAGNGPVLYAGGSLGSLTYLSTFDGTVWQAIPGINQLVLALETFDDGSGPALYAGGRFTAVPGVAANGIARFDGGAWSTVGNAAPDGQVMSLAVHDDGSGPALYAAGDFRTIGGQSAPGVARWNGEQWSPVGEGIEVVPFQRVVRTLASVDLPALGGRRLLAGGSFLRTGSGVTVDGVAVWDGTAWTSLGGGFGTVYLEVRAFDVFDEGEGPELYAGGQLYSQGSPMFEGLARFDGTSWRAVLGYDRGDLNGLETFRGALWCAGYTPRVEGRDSLGVARRFPSRSGQVPLHIGAVAPQR